MLKEDKVKPNEFTQTTPGYFAIPENTGFNPPRKWIKLKTKKVKTSKKLVFWSNKSCKNGSPNGSGVKNSPGGSQGSKKSEFWDRFLFEGPPGELK